MSLTSFKVVNQKSIRRAEATNVPRVMVIAGPNGVGKSTLLYAIKQGHCVLAPPDTKVLYQGPHRVLRRTTVSRKWLTGAQKWMADLLTSGDVSGYEGLSFGNTARTPDNVDEAGSTIKHTLGKLENRRQSFNTDLIDTHQKSKRMIDPARLPDVYGPIKDLTKYLLPHLEFSRMDFTNEDNIRCLWKRTDAARTLEIDIDDLSSGEKSIVVLFLPLIEDQIRDQIRILEDRVKNRTEDTPAPAPQDRVLLIDEPEQHLHPDLQAKLLSYIRSVSRTSSTQFVITTHSPTILDQATDDELYLLAPPDEEGTDNQLKRIASSIERLEALKQLAGSAYFLTTGRVLVCIEGTYTDPDNVSDLRLLEVAYPRATAFTLAPCGGRGNVINAVKGLRESIPEDVFRIRVRGLVDADQRPSGVAGVYTLPVCMIENLLLDPEAIYAYCALKHITAFADASEVRSAIQAILVEHRDNEIGRRVGQGEAGAELPRA